MEDKHTPGPWTLCEHNWSDTSIQDKDGGKTICSLSIYEECTEENQDEHERNMRANAELIAKAPELLQANRELVEALRNVCRKYDENDDIEVAIEFFDKAEQLLSKYKDL